MNKELLKQLYAIHSPSGNEKKMRKFVKKYAYKCGIEKLFQDEYGNIFITKGVSDTYPCVAAHLDQVQDDHSKDFVCIEGHGVIFGYSAKSHQQQGLGADDKNGILICLECLKRFDVIKVAFFVGEETGCKGSSQCDLSFFKDCRFIIEPDRRGSSDLITSMFCGDVCSGDFIDAINADKFGYSETQGSITDVGELVKRGVGISCLNLSCGYYEAHTDTEFTVIEELENCLSFVCEIIEKCVDVYPFVYTPKTYASSYSSWGSYGKSYKSDYYSWYDDYDYYDKMDMEDRAYEAFETALRWHPTWSYEEASIYLSVKEINSLGEKRLREIFDEVKMYSEPYDGDYWDDDTDDWKETSKVS
jgi:hypothetical protein